MSHAFACDLLIFFIHHLDQLHLKSVFVVMVRRSGEHFCQDLEPRIGVLFRYLEHFFFVIDEVVLSFFPEVTEYETYRNQYDKTQEDNAFRSEVRDEVEKMVRQRRAETGSEAE